MRAILATSERKRKQAVISEHYRVIGISEADVFLKSNSQLHALLPKPLDTDEIKRLADVLSFWCTVRIDANLPPMLRRLHAAKFYGLANAGRSAATAGQEAVDDFLQIMADPVGARETMEQHVLPLIKEFGLTEMLIPVRSHYAIVLAWCGEVPAARRELRALSEYGGSPEELADLRQRTEFVDAIAAGRVRLKKMTPPPNALKSIPGALPLFRTKIGRNDPCPCGSGRKYKRCHGAV